MVKEAFRFTTDNELQREQRIRNLENFPPFGSVVEVEFAAGTERQVNHGLNRTVEGYIVIRTNKSSVVYESSETSRPRKYLLMTHDAAASKVTIWFF